jgi:uncharacterized protein YqeY
MKRRVATPGEIVPRALGIVNGASAMRVVLSVAALCASAAAFSVAPAVPYACVHGVSSLPLATVQMSGIQTALKERMKRAMKAGPGGKQELAAVRLMVSALTTKQKESGTDELDDTAAQEALAKLAKMRKESIEMFEKGGKPEAAEAERFELALLEEYLPAMADEAAVREWIAEAIAEVCPDGPDKKLMGKVMGALMRSHKGEFDGKEANKWVGEMLTPGA